MFVGSKLGRTGGVGGLGQATLVRRPSGHWSVDRRVPRHVSANEELRNFRVLTLENLEQLLFFMVGDLALWSQSSSCMVCYLAL